MREDRETCMEIIEGSTIMGYCTSMRKNINYIKKLAEKYPGECIITHENEDGSICANMPANWFPRPKPKKKVNRVFTEEEKAQMAERMRLAREKKNK